MPGEEKYYVNLHSAGHNQGEYLNIDPTLVRLIWAICSVASVGMGLIVYFIAAVVMPESDDIMM